MFPLLIITTLSLNTAGSMKQRQLDSTLNAHRDQLAERIGGRFSLLTIISRNKFLQSKGDPSYLFSEVELVIPAVDSITFFARDYSFLGGFAENSEIREQDIPAELRLALQKEIFSDYYAFRFISYKRNESRLLLFIVNRNNQIEDEAAFAVIMFDSFIFKDFFPDLLPLRCRLLNSGYQVLYDSKENTIPFYIYLNKISRQLLDGFTENASFSGSRHGYTNIPLHPGALFLDVSLPDNTYGDAVSGFRTILFFILIIAVISSLVIAWLIHKEIVQFGENLLVSDRYSTDMLYFSRMLCTIDRVRKDIPNLKRIAEDMQFLNNDLEVLKEKSPLGKKDKVKLQPKNSPDKK